MTSQLIFFVMTQTKATGQPYLAPIDPSTAKAVFFCRHQMRPYQQEMASRVLWQLHRQVPLPDVYNTLLHAYHVMENQLAVDAPCKKASRRQHLEKLYAAIEHINMLATWAVADQQTAA